MNPKYVRCVGGSYDVVNGSLTVILSLAADFWVPGQTEHILLASSKRRLRPLIVRQDFPLSTKPHRLALTLAGLAAIIGGVVLPTIAISTLMLRLRLVREPGVYGSRPGVSD